ncbi:MAG: putative metal-binding motif-containing protein [Byssovorax sp.]
MARPIHVGLVALALVPAALSVARPASAADKKTVSGVEVLHGNATGDAYYSELTVAKDAVLLVDAYDGAKGLGQLHIHANVITVAAGGTISAVGAGFRGRDAMDGEGPSGSMGGGAWPGMSNAPGGGGANGGDGAPGLISMCTSVASIGGKATYDPMKALGLGSAGGAANVTSNLATRGGNGGGLVILEAASVVIDGLVDVSGASPPALGGVGPGGGAGGSIFIHAGTLTGKGILRAKGGDGAHGAGDDAVPIEPNNGGGGSGGVVRISGPQRPASLMVDLGGGASGDCAANHGKDGVEKDEVQAGACVDADGDKIIAKACGGMDCDDSDASVNPGITEVCNGVDDNCDGQIDEGESLCSSGSQCVDGACVPSATAVRATARPTRAPAPITSASKGCAVTAPSAADDARPPRPRSGGRRRLARGPGRRRSRKAG